STPSRRRSRRLPGDRAPPDAGFRARPTQRRGILRPAARPGQRPGRELPSETRLLRLAPARPARVGRRTAPRSSPAGPRPYTDTWVDAKGRLGLTPMVA